MKKQVKAYFKHKMKKALFIGGGLLGAYVLYRLISKGGKKDSVVDSAQVPVKKGIADFVKPTTPVDKFKLSTLTGGFSVPSVVTPSSFSRPANPLDWTSGQVSQYIDEKAKTIPTEIREQIISSWISFAGSKKQTAEYIALVRTRTEFANQLGQQELAKQVDFRINEWLKTQIDPNLTKIIVGSRPSNYRGL